MYFRNKIYLTIFALVFFQILIPSRAASNVCDQFNVMRSHAFVECLTIESRYVSEKEVLKRVKLGKIFVTTGGFNPQFYPTEAIFSVAQARNSENKVYIDSWLSTEIAKLGTKLKRSNYYLIHPDQDSISFGENSQSRLVLGLANIYAVYPDRKIHSLLVSTYLALDKLPLVKVNSSVTNKNFLLPAYTYRNVNAPKVNSGRSLDPNHEATLAASYLAVSKSGVLSKSDSQKARNKAKSYFYAGLDLAIKDKCLALADEPTYIDKCDTRYNAFWMNWMLVVQQDVGNPSTLTILRNQFQVMKSQIDSFSTKRVYPFGYSGVYPDPVEPISLLSAVASFGSRTDFLIFVRRLNQYYSENSRYSSSWPITFLYPYSNQNLNRKLDQR